MSKVASSLISRSQTMSMPHSIKLCQARLPVCISDSVGASFYEACWALASHTILDFLSADWFCWDNNARRHSSSYALFAFLQMLQVTILWNWNMLWLLAPLTGILKWGHKSLCVACCRWPINRHSVSSGSSPTWDSNLKFQEEFYFPFLDFVSC